MGTSLFSVTGQSPSLPDELTASCPLSSKERNASKILILPSEYYHIIIDVSGLTSSILEVLTLRSPRSISRANRLTLKLDTANHSLDGSKHTLPHNRYVPLILWLTDDELRKNKAPQRAPLLITLMSLFTIWVNTLSRIQTSNDSFTSMMVRVTSSMDTLSKDLKSMAKSMILKSLLGRWRKLSHTLCPRSIPCSSTRCFVRTTDYVNDQIKLENLYRNPLCTTTRWPLPLATTDWANPSRTTDATG